MESFYSKFEWRERIDGSQFCVVSECAEKPLLFSGAFLLHFLIALLDLLISRNVFFNQRIHHLIDFALVFLN